MIALAVTVPAVASHGQGSGGMKSLRLDGEAIDVGVDRDRQKRIYHLKLKLRLTNVGERPIILLLGAYGEKKDWWILDTTLSRTLRDALDGKPFYIRPTSPASSQSLPLWKKLRRQLSSSRPSTALTHIVQPQETFFKEVETLVVINNDEAISPGSKVWLKVSLELWPLNIETGKRPEGSHPFGESLRRKWQAFGDLQLEPILSSPIPFDLPPSPSP